MEYCATTLRKIIDDSRENRIDESVLWRMVRQILEALSYIPWAKYHPQGPSEFINEVKLHHCCVADHNANIDTYFSIETWQYLS